MHHGNTSIALSDTRGSGKATARACWAICIAGSIAVGGASVALAQSNSEAAPTAQDLLKAGSNTGEWLLPARTFEGNRYVPNSQINAENVGTLGIAWETAIADDGQQESAPIIHNGTMYFSTPHDNVLALDAKTGALKWQFPYNPKVISFAINRGVGVHGGKVVVGTLDCRLIALDASTGKEQWNVKGCLNHTNSFLTMAPYIFKSNVYIGYGGGDYGNRGQVRSYRLEDGKMNWAWDTIKKDTWKGDSWIHGAASVWTGISFNPETNTAFVGPGNPGPDLVMQGREDTNLYANSIVALDVGGEKPVVKWHYQIIANDTHDSDPAMIPVVFKAKVGGEERDLVAGGDKAGNFVVLNQKDGKLLYRIAVSHQMNVNVPPTKEGIRSCPNHGGGIEWLGGAYDPSTQNFIIPSTNECGTWKIETDDPKYVAGQPYKGGALPSRENATGVVTAIDIGNGDVKWRFEMPHSAQGGALITSTGLVFTSDLSGTIYALDVKTGKQIWKMDTGNAICAPISSYEIDGVQHLAVLIGQPGHQKTKNFPNMPKGSKVLVLKLGGAAKPIINTAANQIPISKIPMVDAASISGAGTVPYTEAQVKQGKTLYSAQCSSCHGDQMQGVSAPALTGAGFAASHLTASEMHNVITTTMPLTAPGSLSKGDYASLMAYILAAGCVMPSDDGKVPFPTDNTPALAKVTVGSKSCLDQVNATATK